MTIPFRSWTAVAKPESIAAQSATGADLRKEEVEDEFAETHHATLAARRKRNTSWAWGLRVRGSCVGVR